MRVFVIHNPAAGRGDPRRQLAQAIAVLHEGGWQVHVADTQGQGQAGALAQQAASRGFDAIVVSGGDGTINQAADGLMKARHSGFKGTVLGILPTGTANVLARELDLPTPGLMAGNSLPRAASELLQAKVEWVDVGRASNAQGSRYFLCWAGVGLDAAVTQAVESHPKIKHLLGPVFFGTTLLRWAGRPDVATRYTMEVDGQVWQEQGVMAVVSNIRRYASIINLAPKAWLNDGLLDLVFFRGEAPVDLLRLALPLLAGEHVEDEKVLWLRAQHILLQPDQPQPVHLDAEPFGSTPVNIEVIPEALPLLVSQPAARRLLTAESR